MPSPPILDTMDLDLQPGAEMLDVVRLLWPYIVEVPKDDARKQFDVTLSLLIEILDNPGPDRV